MKEKMAKIEKEAKEAISKIIDSQMLNEMRVKYLGKKSELSSVLKDMANLSKEERPVVGELVNNIRKEIEESIKAKEIEIEKKLLAKKLEKEKVDITLPSTKVKRGTKHPVSSVIEEIEDLFVSMGYTVETGPELETDKFCFELLNLPKRTSSKRYARQFLYYRRIFTKNANFCCASKNYACQPRKITNSNDLSSEKRTEEKTMRLILINLPKQKD